MTPKAIVGEFIINGQADFVARACDDGFVSFYSDDMPADIEREPPSETLLARARFASKAFGAAKDGVIEANKAERTQAVRTGDPKYFRATTKDGKLAFAGTAGTKQDDGSRPNFLLNAKTFVEGQFVDISGMKYAVPRKF